MDILNSWLVNKPIAHRGLWSNDIPENSLAAFEAAIQAGFAIEIDVRMLDDGTVVVFHDDFLKRMTGRDGYVNALKKEELTEYTLAGTEQHIPTLKEALELIAGRVPLLIETKNTGKVGTFEQAVIDLLQGYKGEIALQSFNPYSLGYFEKNAPEYPRGQLASYFRHTDEIGRLKKAMLKRLKLNNVSKPHFIGYDRQYLPNKYVRKAGLPVLAWTIRSGAEMEAVLPYCDNVVFEKFIPLVENDD